MFAKKLSFLMELTNTKNKVLAKAVKVDPSYISIIRSGKRIVYNKQTFILPMAEYFSEAVNSDYQKKALCEELGICDYPKTKEEFTTIILNYLCNSNENTQDIANNILQVFSNTPSYKPPKIEENIENIRISNEKTPYYYGNKGKQEAFIRFLSEIIESKKIQTLLIFTDEDISWIYEDYEYAKKWGSLLTKALMLGNRMKVIHSVTKDTYGLFKRITKWIPIYTSGLIEPYYYPNLKDGIFRHTFFIAPESNRAIVSSSVQQNNNDTLHFYINDNKAINSLTEEFNNYLNLCSPLMHIYNLKSFDKLKNAFENFYMNKAKTICLHPLFPLSTMPKSVFKIVSKVVDEEIIRNLQMKYFNIVKNNMDITEIISVADENEINSNKINFPYSNIFGIDEKITMTKADYEEYFNNTKTIVDVYKNFKLLVNPNCLFKNMLLFYKENIGVLMINIKYPCTTFLIQESNITNAFGLFLNNLIKKCDKY